MEGGQQFFQVINGTVDDIKQIYPDFNVENVQVVINNEDNTIQYGNQLVQMQAGQPQEQTYVLHQQDVQQVQQPQVVFHTQPVVSDEQDQPVSW